MSLVVFVEEPSMEATLRAILQRITDRYEDVLIVPHQGAGDLEASLPRKLRAWKDPNARFLILRDNDGGDCTGRKLKLADIARDSGRAERTKVRIICRVLEAWFIGDQSALRSAGFGRLNRRIDDPDAVIKPSRVLKEAFRGYQKVAAATAIAQHIDLANPRSRSLESTLAAIRELL